MKSFYGLYIGLSLGFGFLFLAIVAEAYYLLWWRRRKISSTEVEEDDYGRRTTKQPFSSKRFSFSAINEPPEDLEVKNTNNRDFAMVEEEEDEEEEEDLELMGLYNLAGQPRFLFTITEETKEDLESDDGKSNRSRKGSRTRSLSDVIMAMETPFFTPMASPPLKASLESFKHHGFNPLYESSLEMELNRLRSSPPPKMKFLRDAEEKLYRRLMEEAQKRAQISALVQSLDLKSMAEEREQRKPVNQRFHYSSGSSQVLPLVSSPPEGFC